MKRVKLKSVKINNETINIDISLEKSSNTTKNNKKNKKINYNKFVNNKNNEKNFTNINIINNTNNENISNKTSNTIEEVGDFKQYSPGAISSPLSNLDKDNKDRKRDSSSKSKTSNPKKGDTHNYSPDNSYDLLPELSPDYEEFENNINDIFDEELKNLEQDEEVIKRLLDQLNNGNFNDLCLNKNSGDSLSSSDKIKI